jgi:hypothetical protein
MAEVYDRLKLDELEGITAADELMRDPQKRLRVALEVWGGDDTVDAD